MPCGVSLAFSFSFFPLEMVSLCSPSCPGTHSVDQTDLELGNPPASASEVQGLKACATTARLLAFSISQKQRLLTEIADCLVQEVSKGITLDRCL